MPLVTPADYDWIRHKVNQDLNSSSMPDGRIEENVPEAEEWVAGRVTDLDDIAVSVVEADVSRYTHAKRAAWYYTAHLVAKSWSPVKSESIAGAGSSWSKEVTPPKVKAAELLLMAEGEVEEATVEVETATRQGYGGSAQSQVYW